jgi:hypothetical protein
VAADVWLLLHRRDAKRNGKSNPIEMLAGSRKGSIAHLSGARVRAPF